MVVVCMQTIYKPVELKICELVNDEIKADNIIVQFIHILFL